MKTTLFGAEYGGRFGGRLARSLTLIAVLAGIVFLVGFGMPRVASANIESINVGSQSPNPVVAGNSATFAITANLTNSDYYGGTQVIDVTGLPAGASWGTTCEQANRFGSGTPITLTINTTGTMDGVYHLTVTVREYNNNSTCGGGTDDTQSVSVDLFVNCAEIIQGNTNTNDDNDGTLTIGRPSGVQEGDVLIANFSVRGSGASNNLTSSGWSALSSDSDSSVELGDPGGGAYGKVLYKIAGSSEPSSYTFSISGDITRIIGAISAFRGVDTSDPFDAIGVHQAQTSSTVTAPGITTIVNNAMIVFLAQVANSDSYREWSGDFSELYDQNYNSSSHPERNVSIGAATWTQITAGATGAGTVRITQPYYHDPYYQYSSDDNAGMLVALAPYCTGGSIGTAPGNIVNPENSTITYGANTSFTSTASGDPTPSVQWQVDTGSGFGDITDGGVYSGATTTTLNLTLPPVSYSGYLYRAVFTNTSGTATSDSAELTVNPRNLTISGAVAQNKVYDGTNTATVDFSSATLATVVDSDDVSIDYSSYSAAFNNKNVGNNKPVTVLGVTLSGTDKDNYTVSQPTGLTANITPRPITVTAVTDTKVYDGTTSSSGVPTITLGTLAPGDTANWTQTFDTKDVGTGKTLTPAGTVNDGNSGNNYTVTFVPVYTGEITCKYITVSAHVPDKVYDTTTDIVGTIGFSSSGIIGGDDVVFCYDTVNTKFPSADAGNYNVEVLGINICGGTDENNYCLNNTSDYDWAKITKAPTTTTVHVYDPNTTTDASPIEWMDAVDFHAEVSGCPDDPVSGTVAFEVDSTTYGTVPVDGSNDADLGDIEIANPPTNDYTVTATFVSSNPNCSGSSGTTTLHVDPREADSASALGFYTGDRVAWTPNENSNSASVKLAATIVDNDGGGDITQATVTFLMNGEPIPGAKDLPVGLVDPDDPTVGVAAAIVQFNMSQASDSEIFNVTVKIGGNYTTGIGVTQAQIMLIVPTPGGRILGANATLANENASGYLGTNPTGCILFLCGPANYSFSAFDISYNKSLRNPQGKLSVLLLSVNDQNGEEDRPWYNPHVYLFTSNAITALNVTGNTALFSAKCTVKELVDDNWFAIEGNAKMDVTMTDLNPAYPASYDTLGITVYKKRGGLWFSSNWNGVYTTEQNVFLIKDQLSVQP